MDDISSILDDPKLKKWLDTCPTTWNIEYSEEWEQYCFFVCPPGIPAKEYQEIFIV